jgi:hypothetical protein
MDPIHDILTNGPMLVPVLSPLLVPLALWWRRVSRKKHEHDHPEIR